MVAYRDRLARFGTELIEQMLEQNGGELLVLNQRDLSPPEELTQDLLAILTVFSARANGLRRYRKKIQEDKSLPRPKSRNPQLKLWFDAARFTYNRTIELLNSDGAPKASWLGVKKDILGKLPEWTKPAPYEVKSNAVREACLWRSAQSRNSTGNLQDRPRPKASEKSRPMREHVSAPGRIPARPFSSTRPPSATGASITPSWDH